MKKFNLRIGFIVDWNFHLNKKWTSIFAPYFVKNFIKFFNPIVITSQEEYDFFKTELKFIFSMEPGWGAPFIKFDKRMKHIVAILISDPHNKVKWLETYITENNINYVFSLYFSPFFYHFPNFPKEKFIHFPWAVPDELIPNIPIKNRKQNFVAIFGGKDSDAYDIRNWCRRQPYVKNFDNSGVENKKFTDEEFFLWLGQFDAVIAAGSSNPKYDLVTPKYFEIPSVGSLLIGQYCNDLKILGFNENNMIIFNKNNFRKKIDDYLLNQEKYLSIRKKGKELILNKHLLSHRLKFIKNFILKVLT